MSYLTSKVTQCKEDVEALGTYLLAENGGSCGMKAWQKLAFGELTLDNLDNAKNIRGYFWTDANVGNHEIKRTRQYPHKLKQFPKSDPYHSLYALADSDNHSDFWLALEGCQQNRSKVSYLV